MAATAAPVVPDQDGLDASVDLTGSTARFAIGGARLSPLAPQAAAEAALGDPREGGVCRNPYRAVLVRAVETLYAVGEAPRIIEGYEPPARPYTGVPPDGGVGRGATEAPRGLLHHRCELDPDGTVTGAPLVPPTAQDQGAIEDDLLRPSQRAIGEHAADDAGLTAVCERAIRNHDPCISCPTRFLDLRIVRTSSHTTGGCDA